MAENTYKYIIVGGGLAGASAVDGIREIDKDNPILLVCSERHLPYDRPPLTKKLWFGKKTVDEIFVHDKNYYQNNGVDLALDERITLLNLAEKQVEASNGKLYSFDKLLLATGGEPRHLQINGAELEGVCYYRYLDDYLALRPSVSEGKCAVVIGAGFIGSEMAAALNINGVRVKMIFPEPYIATRVFPEGLGWAMQEEFEKRGIEILAQDVPESIEKDGAGFVTRTRTGQVLKSDFVLVGVGMSPSTDLADDAGLTISNGIMVNEQLQTSHPDIYAAGDNAHFPYQALKSKMRIEHWDNALNQGKQAGRNMAGANEVYGYMPYFFSDLFDFGYEAVGDVDSRLGIFTDWQEANKTGVVYYTQDSMVRGAMMCNLWDKVPAARELIREGKQMSDAELRGAIK